MIAPASGGTSHHACHGAHREAHGKRDEGVTAGPSQGLPEDLHRRDRVGQALQRQLPHRPARVPAAAAGDGADHIRGQDLPTFAAGTEPRRLDHRVPEVVALLPAHLAHAEADPKVDRVLDPPIVLLDGLLHGHPAGQGRRGGGEDDHEAVAQVLHLGAAHLGDRLAQDREVGPADLVGGLLGQTLRQLRRTHDVREEDRHVLGGHWSCSAARTPPP